MIFSANLEWSEGLECNAKGVPCTKELSSIFTCPAVDWVEESLFGMW